MVGTSDLESIWKGHRPEVRRICRSILSNADEADDVADSVLVDFLFGHLQELRRTDAIGPYLRLMAARRALQRKRRSREVVASIDVPQDALGEEAAERAVLSERIEECAHVLTPKARTVLRLRFAGDLTAEKIGELVGGSKQYIGKLITKSCALLRECVAKHREERFKKEVHQRG